MRQHYQLLLHFIPRIGKFFNLTSCYPVVSPSGNLTLSSSGIYTDSLTNSQGCDSLVTINFTLSPLNFLVEQNSDSLWVSTADFVNYQWIDCVTNLPITGSAAQSFIPTATGDYAVIVENRVCTNTSDCFPYNVQGGIGINENELSRINLYPNPVCDYLTIELQYATDLTLLSSEGKLITRLTGKSSYSLDVSSLENGVYFVLAKNGSVQRFVKQN